MRRATLPQGIYTQRRGEGLNTDAKIGGMNKIFLEGIVLVSH